MAAIADRCPAVQVTVVDISQARIDAWNTADLSKLPVYEPGLDAVVVRARGRNLHFSTAVEEQIAAADMVFISVNTPTKTRGLGAGQASDLRWVEACARSVAKAATGHTIVMEKSTMPARTAETVQSILAAADPNGGARSYSVLSIRNFWRRAPPSAIWRRPIGCGSAVRTLLRSRPSPPSTPAGCPRSGFCIPISGAVSCPSSPPTPFWRSGLARSTAFCMATGADVREVARAIGTDSRISLKFLQAGPGFGSSFFQKDILNLVYLCRHFGLPEVADYWASVVQLNTWQQHLIARLVVQKLFGTMTGKRLAILGFAFKADTNDTREAPAIRICRDLLEEGAQLAIHDPKVEPDQIERDLR